MTLLLVVSLLAASAFGESADSPIYADLEQVRDALIQLPATETADNTERRRLLEHLEMSLSRQLGAQGTIDRYLALKGDLDTQLNTPVAVSDEPISPDEADALLAEGVSAIRDLHTSATALDMLSVQEMAARAHLDRTLANERAIAESQSSTAAERGLARLRVQEASEALKAFSAERSATEILRDIDELKAQLTRRRALAAGTRPLDEQSLTDFLERHRQAAEETTQKINEAMNALADQQQVLAGARQVRDRLDANEFESEHRQAQWRVDAERSKAERLELELRALRIELERSSIQSDLWESRGAVMLTDSLENTPQAYDFIELSRGRLELGREYFLSVQSNTQAELDALDAALRGASGTSPGHTWLVERRRELRSMQTAAQRALSAVIALGVFLEGSELHLNHLASRQSLTSWLQDRWQETGSALQAIWRYELFTVEDTILVDGQQVTGQLGITVAKVGSALLLLTLGIWISAIFGGFIRRRMLQKGLSPTAAALGFRLFNLGSIAILVIMAFTVVNIPLTVFGFVGGALALGVGLGAQNLVNNFISGMILLIERPIEIDDVIEIDGVRGTVRRIASRFSQIRRFDGLDLLIPNSELLERQVINLTLDDPQIRLTIRVGVAYGSPTRETTEAILQAARTHGLVLDSPPPFVLFEDFGDSALVFSLNFWVQLNTASSSPVTASDLRYMIEKNLREAGIEIAFPQRDVHLDVKGPVQVQLDSR